MPQAVDHEPLNADPRVVIRESPHSDLAQALYFKSGERTLFGWLHQPAAGARVELGLLICKPFGYEAVCGHRSVRAFAEAATAAGVPALRFDYSGTGDSVDMAPESDQLDAWAMDVMSGVEELRRRTGVTRVCVLGIRLGALLACLAIDRGARIDSLILIAPVLNGRQYLRELRTIRLVGSLRNARESLPISQPTADGAVETSGFSLSAATLASLADVDLSARTEPPSPSLLVIDAPDLSSTRAWTEAFLLQPSDTSYLALPGVTRMIMTEPQFAVVPLGIVTAIREWLARLDGARATGNNDPVTRPPLADEPATRMTLVHPGSSTPAGLTEQPVLIDAEASLFAIVTEPQLNEQRGCGVVLLNTGADYHIGANRMSVSLARRWAAYGYTVLRLDLGGIGDSRTRAGKSDDDVFPSAALEDIRAAIDFLHARYGVTDLTLGGMCSGAYHALRAAAAEVPVDRILMVNPLNFFWKEGATLKEVQLTELVRNPDLYLERLFSYRAWRRVLTGKIRVWRLIQLYVQHSLLGFESALRDLARRARIRLPRDLGNELEAIASRGVQMVFVFAKDEPGFGLLKYQGGSSVKRLGDRCKVHIIDGGDHVFTQSGPRTMMENVLTAELLARGARAPAPTHD